MKNKKAFTLVELLAVIVILGLLFTLTIPAVSSYINETREKNYSLHEADMKTAASNMMSECVQNNIDGCVPENGESKVIFLKDLVEDKYSEEIKDPENTDLKCDKNESYVVVTNSSNNVVELDYQVCLVCSEYKSDICDTVEVGPTCDKDSDLEAPSCDNIVGQSTVWTNKDRVISVDCQDSGCGCVKDTYYKTFTESAKQAEIVIEDKAENTKTCSVNVFVDKDKPTCTIEVVQGTLGSNDWYGGSAPIVEITSMSDSLSGVGTYGIGVSKNNPDFNKEKSYEVSPGISMIYGYVKDEAGNIGTCSVEVKYDSVIPTGEVTYGYQIYPKSDIATKSGSTITFNDITGEFGDISGIRVILSSNSGGMSTTLKNGSTTLASRTISSGVTEMLYTFTKDNYENLSIDMGSSSNANLVSKIELITDHTMSASNDFYTNQDIVVYITSQDSFSGKAEYSFDGGSSWQTSNKKVYSSNQTISMVTKDIAGNNSDAINATINNIDKLKPLNAVYETNGGTYTINVGSSSLKVSSKITVDDSSATTANAKSKVRGVSYAWTTTTTPPTTWSSTSNGSTLDKTSSGGSNYLWIKIIDKAGNETISMSDDFNVGYQVTFDCNGGSGCPLDQRKAYQANLSLSSTVPTRSGYDFMGWGTSASTHTVSYASGGTYKTDAPIKLYAIWRKTLTFTFNANGASLDATSKYCYIYNAETNCDITLPTITRSGFTISGFNTSASSTSIYSGWTSGATVSVSASTKTTWYAITSKVVTIKFDKNNASSITKNSDTCTIHNSATSCSITSAGITAPTNTPTVLGWNTSSSSTSSTWNVNTAKDFSDSGTWYAITKKNKVTLTAKWNANNATLSSTSDSTCDLAASYNGAAQSTSCTVTAPTITAPTNTPTILGFNTSSNSTSNNSSYNTSTKVLTLTSSNDNSTWYVITTKAAVTLTAKWNANNATLSSTTNSTCTLSATYNGTAQSTSCTVTAPTITAPTNTPTIVGFNTSSSSTSNNSSYNTSTKVLTLTSSNNNKTWYAITKKNKVTLTAKWNANNATLSSTSDLTCDLAASYNGTAQSTSCTVTAPTITAPTNTPTVVGFNTSSSSTSNNSSYNTSTKVLTLTSSNNNKTWYAITKKSKVTRTLTYNGNGHTSGSMSNSSCDIAATYNGTAQGSSCTVSLSANGFTKSGYNFKGWGTSSTATSGSAAGTNVSLSSNKTYYAIWGVDTPGGYPEYLYTTGSIYIWRATASCTAYGATGCETVNKCSSLGSISEGTKFYLVGKDTDYSSSTTIFLYVYLLPTYGAGYEQYYEGNPYCNTYDANTYVEVSVDGSSKTLPAVIEYNGENYFLTRMVTYCQKSNCGYVSGTNCIDGSCDIGWVTSWRP